MALKDHVIADSDLHVMEPPDLWQRYIDPAFAQNAFYHDCPDDVAQAAIARLCPQPVAPQQTPLWPRTAPTLPRHYIVCEADRTIPPAYQHRMATNLPDEAVHHLPSGHSPFLSMPNALATLLAEIRQSLGH